MGTPNLLALMCQEIGSKDWTLFGVALLLVIAQGATMICHPVLKTGRPTGERSLP